MADPLPLHQHHTAEGPVDCHVSDCDVYVIQRQARADGQAPPPPGPAMPRGSHDVAPGAFAAAVEACITLHDAAYAAGLIAGRAEGAKTEAARLTAVCEPEQVRFAASYVPSAECEQALRDLADLLDGDDHDA